MDDNRAVRGITKRSVNWSIKTWLAILICCMKMCDIYFLVWLYLLYQKECQLKLVFYRCYKHSRDVAICWTDLPFGNYYIFIISQLWLTSHPRSIVVLPDTGTPGASREIYSEDADGETRTRTLGNYLKLGQ